MATADVPTEGGPAPGPQVATSAKRAGVRALASRVPAPLALILLVGVLQSIAWNLITPALQGPDESAHYAYVQHLAETGHLPSARGVAGEAPEPATGSIEEQELLTWLNLRPLVANYVMKPAWSSADLSLWHRVEQSLPRGSRASDSAPFTIAKNPPLYYALMTIPYRAFVWLPVLKRLFVLRLFNMLFYLATIALVWLIAGEVFGPARWKQALAAGAVALVPQLAFMSAMINADNLLIALTTAFLLACLRLVRRGPSLATVLAPSVLAAAAVLTHGRGLVTLPVLLVALVAAWIRYRPAARQTLTLAAAGVAPVGVALLAYFLFARSPGSSSLYGGQIGALTGKAGFKVSQFLATFWNFYFEKFISLGENIGPKWGYRQVFIEQFYGAFGSLEVTLTPRGNDIMQALSAVGLVGLLAALVVRWRQLVRAWPIVVVLLALLLTQIVFLHYVNYRSLLNDGGTEVLLAGRYLLPMIALFGLAIAFTVGSLPRRLGPPVGAAILGVGVIVSFAGIGLTAFRFYA